MGAKHLLSGLVCTHRVRCRPIGGRPDDAAADPQLAITKVANPARYLSVSQIFLQSLLDEPNSAPKSRT